MPRVINRAVVLAYLDRLLLGVNSRSQEKIASMMNLNRIEKKVVSRLEEIVVEEIVRDHIEPVADNIQRAESQRARRGKS